MNRSLCFSIESNERLRPATTMESAVLEVLTVPDDYSDAAVQTIAETVLSAGAIERRTRTGPHGGPVLITWAALVEKGIELGVLEERET
jgi:hypothetical protein